MRMPRLFRTAQSVSAIRNRTSLLLGLACAALLVAAPVARAQFGPPAAGTQVEDASALKPPAGARVAIVEFDDLECPACAHANPILMEATARYRIPWVRHDLLIPSHTWSLNAAVKARWFDTRSKALGDAYRNQVFANQTSIYNLAMLSEFTDRFAVSYGVKLPASFDPEGKLMAEVQADNSLGKRTGVHQTPTIFVVYADGKGTHFVEVRDLEQNLDSTIDMAMADTRAAAPAKARRR